MIKPHCLKGRHTFAEFPSFPCPKCASTLLPVDKKFDPQQSAESKFHEEHVESGPDYHAGVFSLLLRCSVDKCGEAVFCVGTFYLTQEESPGGELDYVPSLRPAYFIPPLPIFSPPATLPDKVAKPLYDSFALFWNNPSASGNSLRVAIEALMDHRCVKKWVLDNKGKEQSLGLHDRIIHFKKQEPDLAEKLLAIKWIGNGGSHMGGLELKDMIVAFRLMEHVLDELFNKTTEALTDIARRINKKKKA